VQAFLKKLERIISIKIHVQEKANTRKTGRPMQTLLIIPCYNEQDTILTLYREITKKTPYDVLVVNDCSNDRSRILLSENAIPHLDLLLNLGIGGAVQAGYRFALRNGYDIAVQLDGDGQHDPSWVSSLIAPIEQDEADLVIGSRFLRKEGFQSSTARRIGIAVFKVLLFCLSGKWVTDATSGFRAANRKAMGLFELYYARDYPEPESIMFALRNRLRVCETPVVMRNRQGGVSSIRSFKSMYYMFKVSFSILMCALQPKVTGKYQEKS
jgi:glycosyltransferase involved in cell wall biosynthesis